MPFNVYHSVNPFILGRAAMRSGAAGSERENYINSLEAGQRAGLQASSIGAQMQQQAASQAFQGGQREADRQVDAAKYAYGTTSENAWRKQQLEQQAVLQREQVAATAQQNERRTRAEFIQEGLKTGALHFDPKMNQEMAKIQQARATTAMDASIPHDVKQRMLAQQDQAFNDIYMNPQVNTQPKQAFHESVQSRTAIIDPVTGQSVPLGTKPLRPGDQIVSENRSGAIAIKPYEGPKPSKPTTVLEHMSQPEQQSARLNDILKEMKDDRKSQFDLGIKRAELAVKAAEAQVTAAANSTEVNPAAVSAAQAEVARALAAQKLALEQPLKTPTMYEAQQQLAQEMNPTAATPQPPAAATQGQPAPSEVLRSHRIKLEQYRAQFGDDVTRWPPDAQQALAAAKQALEK